MNKLRILLVEDVAADRQLIVREVMREFPHAEMLLAHDPEKFNRFIKTCDFDVVIMDWRLGWSDGTSLLKAIKSRCQDRPVVMYTGEAHEEEAVEAMKSGLDDFVVKSPSSIPRLAIAIRSVLQLAEHRRFVQQTERLAVVGRLAATVAHEIFNPLDSLSNILYLLSSANGDGQTELLKMASDEVKRIGEITSRTLGFTRESPEPVPVVVRSVMDDVIFLYQRRFESAGVTIEKRYDSVPHPVQAFPGELRQLVSNLLTNALDISPRGSRIIVHARSSRDWRDPDRQGFRLTITDGGPGIQAEVRSRIFEPFFTTKAEKGTGLGLWVSQGIVRKHNGSIRVRSSTTPGRSGTCFTVFLPYSGVERTLAA